MYLIAIQLSEAEEAFPQIVSYHIWTLPTIIQLPPTALLSPKILLQDN